MRAACPATAGPRLASINFKKGRFFMLKLPPIFSNGMILQRGKRTALRGSSDPGADIAVEFSGESYAARADGSGDWETAIDASEPGGPFVLSVSATSPGGRGEPESLRIADVYVGDLWICAGQSNMQTPMDRLRETFPEEFSLSPFPVIRQFALPCTACFAGPREEMPDAEWVQSSAESLGGFSGVAWFFARREAERRSMPIGILLAANGGAPIESFMSSDALREFPLKIAEARKYVDPAVREEAELAATRAAEAWELLAREGDRGLSEEWFRPATDASSWRPIRLPGRFDQEAELRGFCGAVWLRRSFVAPPGFGSAASRIELGTIVDADRVFVNGIEVGCTGYRYPPRKYPLPAGLIKDGENSLVIRVSCSAGDGGITRGKPIRITSAKSPGGPGSGSIDLRGMWSYEIGARMPPRPSELFSQWKPTGLFNGMVAPLLRCSVAGVLWYQGEGNTDRPEEYLRMLEAMILDWRKRSGRDDLPFLVVQLPLLGQAGPNDESSKWALLREAQAEAVRRMPRTGLAVALDSGEWNDIHPLNKKAVGERLALAAEALLYGEANGSPGPTLARAERRPGSLALRFEHCGTTLVERGGEAFVSVVDDEGISHRSRARIEAPDLVSVDLSGIERPALVLYAWADNPADRRLYGAEGLPALPFRVALPPA